MSSRKRMGNQSERMNTRLSSDEPYDDYKEEPAIQIDEPKGVDLAKHLKGKFKQQHLVNEPVTKTITSEQELQTAIDETTDPEFYPVSEPLTQFPVEKPVTQFPSFNVSSTNKEQKTMSNTSRVVPSNKVTFTRNTENEPQTNEHRAMSNQQFLAPLPRRFNNIDDVANADDLSEYFKFEQLERVPLIWNKVEFKKQWFKNKEVESVFADCTNALTGEEIRVIGSANAVVRQLKKCNDNFMLPVLGQLVTVPVPNDPRNYMWKLVNADLPTPTEPASE